MAVTGNLYVFNMRFTTHTQNAHAAAMNFHTKLVDVNALTLSHRPSHIDHIYSHAKLFRHPLPLCAPAYRIVYANRIGLHHCVRGCRLEGAAQLAFFVTTNSRNAMVTLRSTETIFNFYFCFGRAVTGQYRRTANKSVSGRPFDLCARRMQFSSHFFFPFLERYYKRCHWSAVRTE